MSTYLRVLSTCILFPLCLLAAVYRPLFGRRDGIKVLSLGLMAVLWTAPWDNRTISQSGWSYASKSILGRIAYVPIQEHLFFITLPILLILLHATATHPRLVTFNIPPGSTWDTLEYETGSRGRPRIRRRVQTLRRQPLGSLFWGGMTLLGLLIVNEAHGLQPRVVVHDRAQGRHAFYLGWILVWIPPVIGWLTWLGGNLNRQDWVAWALGSAYLCTVDTIAIRTGAWSIAKETSLGAEVVCGLPLEEVLFFLLASYLVILASSLITHLHTLLILSPDLPPCPPANPVSHIVLLARVALDPPVLDHDILLALDSTEQALGNENLDFGVGKLVFGREMRIGLIAIYAWCRVTCKLIDGTGSQSQKFARHIHNSILGHLRACYVPEYHGRQTEILDGIPHLSAIDRSAFELFAALVPRLVPVEPFLQRFSSYKTHLEFTVRDKGGLCKGWFTANLQDSSFDPGKIPIRVNEDLLRYADNMAASIASAFCYLGWSVLTTSPNTDATRPVNSYFWLSSTRSESGFKPILYQGRLAHEKISILQRARQMGLAIQLVSVAKDIVKDAKSGRCYIPLSFFNTGAALLAVLDARSSAYPTEYAVYTLPLLDLAESMWDRPNVATDLLPRTARGGTRAVSACFLDIARAIRRNRGEVDEMGIHVSSYRRAWTAATAFCA